MKRTSLFIVLLFVIILAVIYFVIPADVELNRQRKVYTPEQAVFKYVIHTSQWPKWWPGAQARNTAQKSTVNDVTGKLIFEGDSIPYALSYDVQDNKSVNLSWTANVKTGINPFSRIRNYRKAKRFGAYLDQLLNQAGQFLESDKNVYGMHVEKVQLQDSLVLTTKHIGPQTSTLEEIYGMIKALKIYALQHGAKPTGNPILNSTPLSKTQYVTMVAIPVNKNIEGNKTIYIKKMVYHANLLTATIKGGNQTINNAFEQLANYMKDNRYTAPAIPFQELITDRNTEPDTGKWVTRICWPVL